MNSRMSVAPLACVVRLIRKTFIVEAAGYLVFLASTLAQAAPDKGFAWAFLMPRDEIDRDASLRLRPSVGLGVDRAKALALYYKAHRLEQESDDDSALSVYLEIAALDPSDPHLVQRLIGIYTRMGRLNEALALLEKNVARFPKNLEPLLALARFLDQNHADAPEQKLRALRTAEAVVAQFPGTVAAVDHLVRLHLADQHRDKAQAVIEQALRSPSSDPTYWLGLATPARNAFPLDDKETYEKHYKMVSTGIEKALTLASSDPEIQEAAGDFFARNRQPARALVLYEKTTVQRPSNLKTRQKLGQLLRMADRNLEAISLFESLVAIDPNDSVSHKALVSLYEKTDPAQSLTHRADLLRIESGDPRDYATTTSELLQAQRLTEALTLVKRGIFFHPNAALLLYLQARVLSEKGNLSAALDVLTQAETLAKEKQPKLLDSSFYYSWATIAAKAKCFVEAESRFRQSIEKAPKEHPERAAAAYNDLGYLWITQDKNLEAAGELIRTANDLVKDHPPYLDSLGWWYFQKKDYPNALETFRHAVTLARPEVPKELLDHLALAEAAVRESTK